MAPGSSQAGRSGSDVNARQAAPDDGLGPAQPELGEMAASGQSPLLSFVVSIATNVTVLTALLVYFGWKRSETHAQVLGIDSSILGMSTQDYALRSLDALFLPIAAVAVLGLAWLWANAVLGHWIARRRRLGAIGVTARALGLAWLLVPMMFALLAWRLPVAGYIIFPLSFAIGALLTGYSFYLRSRLRLAAAATDQLPAFPAWQSSLSKAFIALIVTLSLFWTVANYATFLGLRLGEATSEILPSLARVVAYSPERLQIDAPAVREEVLEGRDSAYRYKYTGLRLLDHTGGKYFLISDGWSPDYGVVVVIADADPVRLEFVRDLR